jgi:phosphoribosyl-ATP pyrophosphohydrolase/phosphoribosyl-AMP cyclohydrolase
MKIDFTKNNGLVPAIIQDINTGKVLMLAYMDEAALKKTREEGRVTFFSRSKKRLWTKGEISGNFLTCVEILTDCDSDTLLIKAIPSGPVCHKGWDTCFAEKNLDSANFLFELEKIIIDRKHNPKPDSYTSRLFEQGLNRIAQKVGEEGVEVLIAAMDKNGEQIKNEVADLLYHLLVLLVLKKISLEQIMQILINRHRGNGEERF